MGWDFQDMSAGHAFVQAVRADFVMSNAEKLLYLDTAPHQCCVCSRTGDWRMPVLNTVDCVPLFIEKMANQGRCQSTLSPIQRQCGRKPDALHQHALRVLHPKLVEPPLS